MSVNQSDALEVVKQWYASGDSEWLDDGIEWSVLDTFPAGGRYEGKRAVMDKFFPAIRGFFSVYKTEPQLFFRDGDTVVSIGIYHVSLSGDDITEIAFAHRWHVRFGKITKFYQIADTASMSAIISGVTISK